MSRLAPSPQARSADPADAIRSAIAAHGLWKTRFRVAIRDRDRLPDIALVRDETACECGSWLEQECIAALRGTPAHAEACRRHVDVHRAAAWVVELLLEGKDAAAAAALGHHGEFTRASVGLTTHLMRWQRGC